jgi:secreted trypsin-like serine protease
LTTLFCPRKLVGIVSWEPSGYCGHPDNPAVYTKVSAVRDWIIIVCSVSIIPKGITKAVAVP